MTLAEIFKEEGREAGMKAGEAKLRKNCDKVID